MKIECDTESQIMSYSNATEVYDKNLHKIKFMIFISQLQKYSIITHNLYQGRKWLPKTGGRAHVGGAKTPLSIDAFRVTRN